MIHTSLRLHQDIISGFKSTTVKVTLVLSCVVSEILQFLCAPDHTPIPAKFWGCIRCTRSSWWRHESCIWETSNVFRG